MAQWSTIDEKSGLRTLTRFDGGHAFLCATTLPLADGSLFVYSPITELRKAANAPVSAMLAPNHFHNLGIKPVLAAFPDAAVYASAVARPRVAKLTGVELLPLDELRARLPEGVTLLEPPGTRAGEVIMEVLTDDGPVWCAADAFFNIAHPLLSKAGFAMRLFGNGPHLKIGATFRYIAVRDRKAYFAWLRETLDARKPTVLVPGHGDVVRDKDLSSRLLALI